MRGVIIILLVFNFIACKSEIKNNRVQVKKEQNIIEIKKNKKEYLKQVKLISNTYKDYSNCFEFTNLEVCLKTDEDKQYVKIIKNNVVYKIESSIFFENQDISMVYYKGGNIDVLIYHGDDFYASNFSVFILNENKQFLELGNFYIPTEDREEKDYKNISFVIYLENNFLKIETNKNKKLTYNLNDYNRKLYPDLSSITSNNDNYNTEIDSFKHSGKLEKINLLEKDNNLNTENTVSISSQW